MKKIILLIISIVSLFFLLTFFNVSKQSPTTLTGVKLNDYTYVYHTASTNSTFIDDTIYFLTTSSNTYNLYKQNIFTKNKVLITTIEADTCTLNNLITTCQVNNENIIYDISTSKTFQTKDDHIIPYKDTYLTLKDQTLYLNQKKEKITFRKLNTNLKYIDYFKTPTNTHILFQTEDVYYLYNLNEDTYTTINYKNYNHFSKGFYFSNEKNYTIYNLETNTTKTINNPIESVSNYITTYNSLNDALYLYDLVTNTIQIIDLKNQTIKELSHPILSSSITTLEVSNNYLFIEKSNTPDIYMIDLSKLNLKETSINDFLANNNANLQSKITKIEKDLNINIKIKEETNLNYPDFNAEIVNDNRIISDSINNISNILYIFNLDFYNTFYTNNYEGLTIYLTGTLTPNDYTTQISKPAAYSLLSDNKYMIVLDINQSNLEKLIAHELLHNMEFNLKINNITPFENWDTLNPSSFIYNNSYTKEYTYNYTLTEENYHDVYFIDHYSQTFAEEDRARIFENIIGTENNLLKEFPNLYQKGLYLKEELLTYYPMLKNTTLFSNLN